MDSSKSLKDLQLAFVGKLLAGYSHESKNHLAIIKELSGLMDDLLSMENQGEDRGRQRYHEIMATLRDRATQAAFRVGHLSRFAHRMDEPRTSFNVNDILEEELSLLGWKAKQKEIRLEAFFADNQLPSIYNNPSLLQYVVFCIVVDCFERFEAKSCIQVSTISKGQSVCIELSCSGSWKSGNGKRGSLVLSSMLGDALSELGAGLSATVDENGKACFSVTLSSLV
ncbi:MAG: hypothetical protein KKE17_11945 [Proteobacteria bacterium]|nr:hypothetical protein [Pseudomonadota bacterium]MBU1710708.1 hypothetical protein [Pseudomonadota bacterium]